MPTITKDLNEKLTYELKNLKTDKSKVKVFFDSLKKWFIVEGMMFMIKISVCIFQIKLKLLNNMDNLEIIMKILVF